MLLTQYCCWLCLGLQRDTVAALDAVIAEGDADHIPSHYRAWRIAQLGKRMWYVMNLDVPYLDVFLENLFILLLLSKNPLAVVLLKGSC